MNRFSRQTLNFLRAAANADLYNAGVTSSTTHLRDLPRAQTCRGYRLRQTHPSTTPHRPYTQSASPTSTSTLPGEDPPKRSSSPPSPPPPTTHYSFFPRTLPAGPPPASPFTIDLAALRREFLQLQAAAHPDRHSGSADKRRAEALSARINEAYRTLREPLARAQHLLALRGMDVGTDEAARVEDTELLLEVMEAREEVEGAESEEEIRAMKGVNDAKIEGSVRVLEEAFARDDVEGAKRECVRLRYWVNIAESLHAWEKGEPIVLAH